MNPTFHIQRRKARAEALHKLHAGRPDVYFVDAANYSKHRDRYALAVVDGTGCIVVMASVKEDSPTRTEEAAIGLTLNHAPESLRTIICDSKTAILSFSSVSSYEVTESAGLTSVEDPSRVHRMQIYDDDEPSRFGHGNTPARPIRDYRKSYEDEKPTVRFDDRGDTPARPIKGGRDSYDFSPAGRSLSTSSPVHFYGRPAQVLTGEKAHQQEELLRRMYEEARSSKVFEQDILEEEDRGLPEERAPIRFNPPPRGDSEPITSRQFDYFGRPVQVHTGEKGVQAEALLMKQYGRVQSRMRENKRLQETRRLPEEQTFHRQPQMPQRGDIPLRERADKEEVTRESPRHLVTFRPYDYFGRPAQVLTGKKEAQVEELLRKQHEQYPQQLNGRRDRNKEEAVGRPAELERRPVQPPSGRITTSPVDHFGRSVQKLSGEKSGKQMELMSKLTPDVRESCLKDLRKARMKEETDPVRANQSLSRYQNAWKSRASKHTKSLDKEPANDALKEDNVDDKDDYDGSYNQTCLHDRKQGTFFLSTPKVKHTYVYKYKRKAGSAIYPVAVSSSLINPEAPSYVAVEGDLEAASPAEAVLVAFCL
ncbi:hypothetical protein HPB47_006424 [Ixodes persulcatus]|uniref:Uncharacterized protein n=1 Tax=Ixodes persulcatus TaxID=34615 RepID=A0AC60PAB3_IXOPE|nr:hypothetical protein HPB47_006424 [Ixodes persulcatus]